MTAHIEHIPLRDARDRLIELLGIGEPYPLQDLAVPAAAELMVVPFGATARIAVTQSQVSVLYELSPGDEAGKPSARGAKGGKLAVKGDGKEIELKSHRIRENVTFFIRAQKANTARIAFLHQTVAVELAPNRSLKAWIVEGGWPLDATVDRPAPTAARLVNHGEPVRVAIAGSERDVSYQLVALQPDHQSSEYPLSQIVAGTGDEIALQSLPLFEDWDIRIRATRIDSGVYTKTPTALLEVVLPVRVRANPHAAVTVADEIIDYNGVASVTIASSQASVRYALCVYSLADADFLPANDPPAITVPVPGKPAVHVRAPAIQQPGGAERWMPPSGYRVDTGSAREGNGGPLTLQTPPLTEDSLIIVQAQKLHRVVPWAKEMLPSVVPLTGAALVLVKPNPAVDVKPLEGRLKRGESIDVVLTGTQPGVAYQLRIGEHPINPPGYHWEDRRDMEHMRVEVDFAVGPLKPPRAAWKRLRLPTGPIKTAAQFKILATKLRTGVSVQLNDQPELEMELVRVQLSVRALTFSIKDTT